MKKSIQYISMVCCLFLLISGDRLFRFWLKRHCQNRISNPTGYFSDPGNTTQCGRKKPGANGTANRDHGNSFAKKY